MQRMLFREYAKIGKNFLSRISGIVETYQDLLPSKAVPEVHCHPSCPILKDRENKLGSAFFDHNDYCDHYCNKKIHMLQNSQHKYAVRHFRLSKLQIKQLLLYHFLSVDEKGFICNVSYQDVSEYLHCSERSLRVNHKILSDLKLVSYSSNVDSKHFNVLLNDYSYYHLNRYQGGTGYVKLSKELFDLLLQTDHVNTLRLELRELLKLDKAQYESQTNSSTYSFHEMKQFLPKHTHYHSMIEQIAHKTLGFKTIAEQGSIRFTLDPCYAWTYIEPIKKEDYLFRFKEFLAGQTLLKKSQAADQKNLDDLIQMSFEYGFDTVFKSLVYVTQHYVKEQIIMNLGAYVRNSIHYASEKISA